MERPGGRGTVASAGSPTTTPAYAATEVDPHVRDYRAAVPEIRRSRLHPRLTDHLYVHLRPLRDDLRRHIEDLAPRDVLDVYCGARPYEPLFPEGTRYVGLDVDDAYGCADVVSDDFLPFPDASFDLCLCTQAFYFVPDPAHAVREFARVLRPGGHVLLTIPVAYPGTERLYAPTQLRELFADWDEIIVAQNGGTVDTIVMLSSYLAHRLERRVPTQARRVFPPLYALLNALGAAAAVAERRLVPTAPALPPNFLFRARRR